MQPQRLFGQRDLESTTQLPSGARFTFFVVGWVPIPFKSTHQKKDALVFPMVTGHLRIASGETWNSPWRPFQIGTLDTRPPEFAGSPRKSVPSQKMRRHCDPGKPRAQK